MWKISAQPSFSIVAAAGWETILRGSNQVFDSFGIDFIMRCCDGMSNIIVSTWKKHKRFLFLHQVRYWFWSCWLNWEGQETRRSVDLIRFTPWFLITWSAIQLLPQSPQSSSRQLIIFHFSFPLISGPSLNSGNYQSQQIGNNSNQEVSSSATQIQSSNISLNSSITNCNYGHSNGSGGGGVAQTASIGVGTSSLLGSNLALGNGSTGVGPNGASAAAPSSSSSTSSQSSASSTSSVATGATMPAGNAGILNTSNYSNASVASSVSAIPRPMQKVIPTVVYLMSRLAVHMEIEGTAQCPAQVMLAAALGCEELGISNKLLAQNIFGLWMTSSLLEIQLKPHHRPYAVRVAWSKFLEKHSHGNEIEKRSDEPMTTLRRNVFFAKRDEEKIKWVSLFHKSGRILFFLSFSCFFVLLPHRDPKILELLYEEARHNVLLGRYIMEPAHSIMLGGIQARIELGPYNIHSHTTRYFRYFPPL